MQFLGGRTYGVSYIQDGQASTNAIFGTVGNSAPGLDAISELQVLSNSYSAEYGGLAGVVVTTKRGGNDYHGSAFYDFNGDGLNALTYNQKLSGVERGDPNTRDPRAPLGRRAWAARSRATRRSSSRATRAPTPRRSSGAAGPPCPPRPCATATSAARRSVPRDPAHRRGLPGPGDPRQPHRPRRPQHHGLLLPAAQPGDARQRLRRLPAVRAPDPQSRSAPTCASTTRPPPTTRSSCAAATSTAIPRPVTFEGGQRAHQPAAS